MRAPRHLALFATLCLLGIPACDTDDTIESTNTRATAIVVDPAEFLGAFPCGDIEGAPRSYRAKLSRFADNGGTGDGGAGGGGGGGGGGGAGGGADGGSGAGGGSSPITVLTSDFSPRVGCGTPVAFTGITPPHANDSTDDDIEPEQIESGARYMATIEVFDGPPGDDEATPAWTTTCGKQEPAVGRLLEQVIIRDCVPLAGAGTAETAIVVDASAAAAALGCLEVAEGETPGLIDSLSVSNTTEGATPSTVTIACGQDPVRFAADIVAGESYSFRIEGEDADGNLIAGASCDAVARDGLVVPASCTSLSDRAEIVIPVVELLAAEDVECGDGASKVKAALTAGPTTTAPELLACDRDVTIAGVVAGSYLASLEVLDGSEIVLAFSCTGSAPPGSQTTLVCTPED